MLKYFAKRFLCFYRQAKIHHTLARRGFSASFSSHIALPDDSRFIFGLNCSAGEFTIIEIGEDENATSIKGYLSLGNSVYIGQQCNIRASGGKISIGDDTMIANSSVLIAANHGMHRGQTMNMQKWDESRTGITIGSDVWIGCNSVILPGSRIGDGAVVAAGSVVTGVVQSNAIVGGIPAKHLKSRE